MSRNTIFGLFAKSPLKPLQDHSNMVYECCLLLVPFFNATFADNWELATQLRDELSGKERQADLLKREIRLKLPQGLFLPVDRVDMLTLVSFQDHLANYAKGISGLVIGRHLKIPQAMQEPFTEYVGRCLDAARQANLVITEMDQLLETGFRGREVALVEGMITELDNIEDDTDRLQIALRRKLMSLEEEYKPINVMFLYKVLEWTGALADQALRVGYRLEIMLARS